MAKLNIFTKMQYTQKRLHSIKPLRLAKWLTFQIYSLQKIQYRLEQTKTTKNNNTQIQLYIAITVKCTGT